LSDRTRATALLAAASFLAAALIGAGVTPAPASDAPPGAASCSGCHPAQNADTPVPRLAGRDADAVVAAMQAFRGGQQPATVMDRIARGFSDDEVKAIAAWLVTQR
jgi:cytochrome c553